MIDLALRRQCITSTDIGPIFGVDSYRTAFDVWADKTGDIEREPPNDRMQMGKFLEQGIMAAYGWLRGCETEWFDRTVRHSMRPWMAASPDAFVKGSARGVDAKLVHWDQRRKWGETAAEIPESIQLQAWWMMAVTEFDAWDVCALIGDDVPKIYSIDRDLNAERSMIERAEEFHRRFILGGERPPIGGSPASSQWLKQMFPEHKRPNLRAASPEEIETLVEYVEVRLEERDVLAERAVLENRLKLAIGEHAGLVWPDGKFTWRKTKDQTKIDWESCARGLMNQFVSDPEQRETLIGIYTSAKKGYRRIHLDCDLMRESAAEV